MTQLEAFDGGSIRQWSDSKQLAGYALYAPGAGTELAPKDADAMLGSDGARFELVSDQPDPAEIERGIQSVANDALTGEGWSVDSINLWQNLFQEQAQKEGATANSIGKALNDISTKFNSDVSPTLKSQPGRRFEPIGVSMKPNKDGSVDYYIFLNKDNAAVSKNRQDLLSDTPNPNIINAGTFRQGQQI